MEPVREESLVIANILLEEGAEVYKQLFTKETIISVMILCSRYAQIKAERVFKIDPTVWDKCVVKPVIEDFMKTKTWLVPNSENINNILICCPTLTKLILETFKISDCLFLMHNGLTAVALYCCDGGDGGDWDGERESIPQELWPVLDDEIKLPQQKADVIEVCWYFYFF